MFRHYLKAASRFPESAFTLTEVAISMAISALMVGAIITGYTLSARRAEWSAYSLAAQSLAMQRLEQTRATKWDPAAWPAVDELVSSNFPIRIEILDIPISGTNIVYATNVTSITLLSANPPLKLIRVDCSWRFMSRGPYTNSLTTYRTADQ